MEDRCRGVAQQKWVPKASQTHPTMAKEDIPNDVFQIVRSKHKGKNIALDQSTSVVFLDTTNGFEVLTEVMKEGTEAVEEGMDAEVPEDGITQLKALGATPHSVL